MALFPRLCKIELIQRGFLEVETEKRLCYGLVIERKSGALRKQIEETSLAEKVQHEPQRCLFFPRKKIQ